MRQARLRGNGPQRMAFVVSSPDRRPQGGTGMLVRLGALPDVTETIRHTVTLVDRPDGVT